MGSAMSVTSTRLLLVEVAPVVEQVEDVGTAARRHRGRDARLQIVGVDALERDLGAQRLAGLDHLLGQNLVAGRDEVDPARQVELGALRICGRPLRRKDCVQACSGDRSRGTGDPDELPSVDPLRRHWRSSMIILGDTQGCAKPPGKATILYHRDRQGVNRQWRGCAKGSVYRAPAMQPDGAMDAMRGARNVSASTIAIRPMAAEPMKSQA